MQSHSGPQSTGTDEDVVILWISRDTRTIKVQRRPRSMMQMCDAICQYWKEHELPWSITEVIRYAPPQKIFYHVHWIEDDDTITA